MIETTNDFTCVIHNLRRRYINEIGVPMMIIICV